MKTNFQKPLSPENYIRTRARNLEIGDCYINEGWKICGLAQIIITRRHSNGNITIGVYLVDLYALGVKDSFFRFNISAEKLEDMISQIESSSAMNEKLIKTDYVLAHNIIYGAVEFADEYGYKPCREFDLTRFILEEDTEEIELIEIEFGKNGQPLLII
ncbi:MAG: hypothetical protein NTW49_03985 [Bacteroidia bacterium]|nr:hypothetical protein [Bacteroidia bacterium]